MGDVLGRECQPHAMKERKAEKLKKTRSASTAGRSAGPFLR